MKSGIEPRCVELLDTTCISAVNASLPHQTPPFPLKPHIFFKLSGPKSLVPAQQKSLLSTLQREGGTDLRLAKSQEEGGELWDIRKSLVLSLIHVYPGCEVIGTDVCVPISRLAGLIEQYKVDQERINGEIEKDGGEKRLQSLIMGHVGDGNFHSLMYVPWIVWLTFSAFEKGNEEMKKKAQELESTLVMNALALDGTSSGEHGVGIHKLVPTRLHTKLTTRNSSVKNTIQRHCH